MKKTKTNNLSLNAPRPVPGVVIKKKGPRRRTLVFLKKNTGKVFKHVFVTNSHHSFWALGSVILLVVFAALVWPHAARNGTNWQNGAPNNGTASQTQQPLFHLPVTIVYDQSSQDQKTKMDEFLKNLVDPQQALVSTDLQTTWLDYKTAQAQALIAQSGMKYLPQVFIDKSIEQHPQFNAIQKYLNKKGDIYFIRVASLENMQTPPVTGGQVAGIDPSAAKVVIQDYESYSCSHCAEAEMTLKKILLDYPQTVSVVYKHFEPGDVYNEVAQGAECASDQHKFPEMQDLIFKEQPAMLQKLQTLSQTATADQGIAYLKTLLAGYAKTLGLDAKTFQTCLDQKTHSAAIDQQTLDAIDYGVNEPPSFFINSQFQSGLVTYDQFKTIIDAELKK